jgi:type III pantothenate kinase
MNLIIDIGNSSTKLAIIDHQQKIAVLRYDELTEDILNGLLESYPLKKAIISSGKEIPDFMITILRKEMELLHILSYKSRLPIDIKYETPETLGPDRIAAATGAYTRFPGANMLIIDAGSAITFDFLIGTIFEGGNISPGIEMRLKALHSFTTRLPLVLRGEKYSFPGHNTKDAILAGVITGVTYEINEYIRTFEKKYENLEVILTGGDSEFLKSRIIQKLNFIPGIVTDGLNYILEYNAK